MTYLEARTVSEDPNLNIKIQTACIIACDVVRSESAATTNHAARVAWAKLTLSDPITMSKKMLSAVIAQNIGLTTAQILAATDAQIQTATNNAIDLLS